jgi:thymidine phosphorylase
VERQLDVDPEGQLIASVLSKKTPPGQTGGAGHSGWSDGQGAEPEAEIGSLPAQRNFEAVRDRIDLLDLGWKPAVGRSIGPALEMMDVRWRGASRTRH